MTDKVIHMGWSEQISPLAHSSQATWQPFDLSHCIEMHNTHLLGRARQLSQTYFTHSAPILTPRNQPPTVNKQWPPLRESRMSRHTRFNTSRKTETTAMNGIFLGTSAGRYDHRSQPDFVFLLCRKCRNLKLFEMRFAKLSPRSSCYFGETRPCMREAIAVSYQAAMWFGWFQHRIHRVLWFDSFVA